MLKIKKITKLLPKKIQTKRFAYFGMALLILFSVLTYDVFFKSPKVKAATVGTSSSASPTGASYQRNTLVTTKGVIVAIYNLGTIGATGLGYSTSSDQGATWSTAVQIDSSQSSDFSAVIDGNNNIYVDFVSAKNILIRKLSYSAGTWTIGSANTLAAGSSCTGPGGGTGTNINNTDVSLAINSSGRLESIYNSNQLACGVSFLSIVYISVYSDDGITWTNMTGGPGANDGTALAPSSPTLISYGKSIWAVANDPNTTTLFVDMSGSGAWTSVVTITGAGASNGVSLVVYGDSIGIFYSSSGLIYQNYSISTGVLSSSTTISSITNDVLGRLVTDSQNVWAIYDQYVAANSYNIVYKRFNGTSWDTSATAVTTDNLNNQGISVPERVPNTANLPIFWAAGTASPYTLKTTNISNIGTATDSGNQTGLYSGSLTGSSGDVVVKCGVWFYNTVNIVTGMTVKVCASNGQIGGNLTIYANTVTVAGTIDGAGRGLPGGVNIYGGAGAGGFGGNGVAGGNGATGTSSAGGTGSGPYSISGGSAGTNASTAGTGGVNYALLPTPGHMAGGGTGGSGTSSAGSAASGIAGYLGSSTNGDTSTDESIIFGSGGGAGGSGGSGAGGGGGGGSSAGTCLAVGGDGGSGGKGGYGGKGGNGGAKVAIYSIGTVVVSGSINVTGQSATSGGSSSSGANGGTGTTGSNAC